MKYKSIEECLEENQLTREDMKDLILRSALDLLSECANNFDGDAVMTAKMAEPFYFFNKILDEVE